MSTLRREGADITIGGTTYHLAMTLSFLDTILDKYGSLDATVKILQNPGQTEREAIDALCWLLMVMVNDDVEARRAGGEDVQPYTLAGLKHALAVWEFPNVRDTMMRVFTAGIDAINAQTSADTGTGDEKNS